MKELIQKWRQFMKKWKTKKRNQYEGRLIYKPSITDFMEWLSKEI